jgi:hypothetical protein
VPPHSGGAFHTTAVVTSFPLSRHNGGDGTHRLLQPACLFTVHMGSAPSPLSTGAFLTRPLLQAFPLQGCCAGATTPALSGRLVYLQFQEGGPLAPFGTQSAPPSLLRVFFIVYSVFFLFSLGRDQSVQGAMLIWPRFVCGSTMYRLAHLVVCVFPSRIGAGIWLCGNSPGFSI